MSTETKTEYTPGVLILHPDGTLTSPPGPDRPAHVPNIPIRILPFHHFRPNLERAVQCWNVCAPLGKDPTAVIKQAQDALAAAIEEVQPAIADACRDALRALGG